MKENDYLVSGINFLKDTLLSVPSLKEIPFDSSLVFAKDNAFDAILSIPQEKVRLLIQIKSNGQPRFVRDAVNALVLAQMNRPDSYGILIAPYISEEGMKICSEFGVGYLDLSGNCRLAFNGIYIEKSGQANKFVQKRELSSLYSAKSERIFRVLLTYPYRYWKTVELSREANVSLGLITFVKKQLQDREWIEVGKDGFALTQPELALQDWKKAYSYKKNRILSYYTFSSLKDFELDAQKTSTQFPGFRYALAGFSAANYYLPVVRNQRIMVYLEEENSDVNEMLKIKPVPSGANVSVLIPYDLGVFWNAREMNKIQVTSPIQTCLDLSANKGRGEEAADKLFEGLIQKQWSAQKIMMKEM
ncbi:MAG: type IV toxin-antitoxin system AbiEi family antitoxin [Anaerolineaceae bacterium]|nr:type IV toxin-antitoxin system AbiEi family antitoxin [Anaerolineaceae bacterium]